MIDRDESETTSIIFTRSLEYSCIPRKSIALVEKVREGAYEPEGFLKLVFDWNVIPKAHQQR